MASVKPVVDSEAQFKINTEKGKSNARTKLAPLDNAVAEFDRVKNGNDTEKQLEALVRILTYADDYISRQEGKKSKKEQALFKSPSKLLIKRIAGTKALRKQAWERMAYICFHEKKANRVAGGAGALQRARTAGSLQPMHQGYQPERANFEKIKGRQGLKGTTSQINPSGGSYVHDIHEKQGWLDHQRTDKKDPGFDFPAKIQSILAKNVDTLSEPEFDYLRKYFSSNSAAYMGGMQAEVHYARKDERIRQHLLIPDFSGRLLHQSAPANFNYSVWAMDENGNFLAANQNVNWTTGTGSTAQYNHSSLNAGKSVICAGEVKIEDGFITAITNSSGHYKPDNQRLSDALSVLQEGGVDLAKIAEVDASSPGMGNGRHATVGAFWAAVPPH